MTFANQTIKRRCDTAIQDGLELIGFFEAEALWQLAAISRSVIERLRECDFAAAWQLLERREAGATIAFLACDSGLKYLSTDLFP